MNFDGYPCNRCHRWCERDEPCRSCHPKAVRCNYCGEWCDPTNNGTDASIIDGTVACGRPECDEQSTDKTDPDVGFWEQVRLDNPVR